MNNKEEIRPPQWFVVKAVAIPIVLGTGLLMLPWAARSGCWTDPVTALFTATSAMCVTGHTVVDTGGYWSVFGQLVVLALVQLGGLGFMTLAMVSLVLLGRRMSLRGELALTTALGVEATHELKRLLYRAVVFTGLVEGLGALVMAQRLVVRHGLGWARALYEGVFHAVSAFCNAGFALYPDSLAGRIGDPVYLGVMAVLIVLGGLGFLVINQFPALRFWMENRLARGRLTLHARIVLGASLALIAGGALAYGALEWRHALAGLPAAARVECAVFQSISARTAGFDLVPSAAVRPATRYLIMGLMFVGGAPGSTAGGIKVTTLVVLVGAMTAMIRGRREIALLGRTVPPRVISEALAVFLLGLVAVGGLYGGLLLVEEPRLLAGGVSAEFLLFDTISAFGTVGLSTGVVPGLSAAGKLLLAAGMFVGRVGPLAMALMVGLGDTRRQIRYPEEDVTIG